MRTFVVMVGFTLALTGAALLAQSGRERGGSTVAQNTPGFITHANDLGPVDPSTEITVTVWLKLRQEQQLDQLVKQQYTEGHGKFHKWLTQDEFDAQFSPTTQQVKAVQNWLAAHNLSTLAVAENNFFVKAVGTVAAVQKAFHVQINSFDVNGKTFRSNTGDPTVDGLGNVAAITGLDDFGYEPQHVRPITADGTPEPFVPLSTISAAGAFFERACFRGVEAHTFTSGGVTGSYAGNRFGAEITNTTRGHLAPCGYSPGEVHAAYNMNPLYAAGLDGEGETIVIVVAYGSPTIERDAAVFSAFYGLPPIDLSIARAPGLAHVQGASSWNIETTLDVEWAHAMAPRAKIVLVTAPARAALEEAVNYAVVHRLGNTISNSWSRIEGLGNPAQMNRQERILQMAAAKGIAVNFASGDCGDEIRCSGFRTVAYPASSPFATGVGGTSLAMDASRNVIFETGWGTNLTQIAGTASQGTPPLNPPLSTGFVFGAGGGDSLTFAKPDFQIGVSGTMRQVPDIGMLADPFTGAETIYTNPATGNLVLLRIGGTSLATPLFSGLMAIAAQKNGHAGLGQAARLLYAAPPGAVNDVVAPPFLTNVTGSITTSQGTTAYSADALARPSTTVPYYSAFYNDFLTRWMVLTFNTDSSIAATLGYDNVTGVGAPDGFNFVNAIVP